MLGATTHFYVLLCTLCQRIPWKSLLAGQSPPAPWCNIVTQVFTSLAQQRALPHIRTRLRRADGMVSSTDIDRAGCCGGVFFSQQVEGFVDCLHAMRAPQPRYVYPC